MLRIAPESFLIAGWRMIRPQSIKQSTNENNTDVDRWVDARRLRINDGNHVRNRDAVDRNRYLVEHNAVDTICACP